MVAIAEVPAALKNAIIAAEDERFYEHAGIDYIGVLRAAYANLVAGGRRQGASTITMQVARNFFLSSEKTLTRKLYEALLAFKIEHSLTKEQILELYVNQIYLGQRAYGFGAASQIYFGKALDKLNLAETAMLAGLPKAPSLLQPHRQPPARQAAPAVRAAPHDRARPDHAGPVRRGSRNADPAQARSERILRARRVRRRNGAPGDRGALSRRGLQPRLPRLHHYPESRPGSRLRGAAQGGARVRPAQRLPRPRGFLRAAAPRRTRTPTRMR